MKDKAILPVAVALASGLQHTPLQSAMYINDNGTGETLIFPFYSVEDGNNTLINVANATEGHKAVKVRMLGGARFSRGPGLQSIPVAYGPFLIFYLCF